MREGANDQTSFVDRFGAGAGYTFRGRRSELSFLGDGSRLNYHNSELSPLSRWAYGGGATAFVTFSRRSSLTLAERYDVSTFDSSSLLETSGLPVSLATSRANRASAELDLGLTDRLDLALGVRHQKISFDEDDPESESLVPGNRLTYQSALTQRLGRYHTLTAGYSYQQSLQEDLGADLQSFFGGWAGRFGRRYGAALTAGASRVSPRRPFPDVDPDAESLPPLWRFFGSAQLSAEYQRSSLAARYTRSVNHAYGFGRDRVADLASVFFTRMLGRATSLSVTTSYGRSRALDPDVRLDFQTISAAGALQHALSRRFDLTCGYRYGVTKPAGSTSGEDRKSERAFVALTFGRAKE